MSQHLRQAHEHICADIARLEGMRDQIASMLGDELAPAAPAAGKKRQAGRQAGRQAVKPAKSTRGRKAAPGPKRSARAAALKEAGARAGGRQPSPQSAACRSSVLLALLKSTTSLSFTQVRDEIAGVMKKNGVDDADALASLLQMTGQVLKGKGLIDRVGGAWSLTAAGRQEAISIRDAVKNSAASAGG